MDDVTNDESEEVMVRVRCITRITYRTFWRAESRIRYCDGEIAMLRLESGSATMQPDMQRRWSVLADKDGRAQDVSPRIAINTIAELLSYFDGDGNKFEIWEKQVRLFRATYNLNNDTMCVLIGSRLKGRVNWLHSRAQMSVNELLRI